MWKCVSSVPLSPLLLCISFPVCGGRSELISRPSSSLDLSRTLQIPSEKSFGTHLFTHVVPFYNKIHHQYGNVIRKYDVFTGAVYLFHDSSSVCDEFLFCREPIIAPAHRQKLLKMVSSTSQNGFVFSSLNESNNCTISNYCLTYRSVEDFQGLRISSRILFWIKIDDI